MSGCLSRLLTLRLLFKEGQPGYDWLQGFSHRHPDIAPQKMKHLSNSHAIASDPEVLRNWFQLLDSTLTAAGVKDIPAKIFNPDKVCCHPGPEWCKKNSAEHHRLWKGANYSCGSASGKLLPIRSVRGQKLASGLDTGWVRGYNLHQMLDGGSTVPPLLREYLSQTHKRCK